MTPNITTYIHQTQQIWYVNVYWPRDHDNNTPPFRRRASLGIPATEDPAAKLKAFQQLALPAMVDQYQAHCKNAQRPNAPHRNPGPLLRDLAAWYLETHLPYMDNAPKTISHYSATLYDFIAYANARHVARAQQLSSRLIQEWQNHSAKLKNRTGPSRDQVLHLRRFLTVCHEQGELKELPPIAWAIPKKRKGTQHQAHEREIIDPWLDGLLAWRPHAGRITQWVDATGWRIGDALDLRINEIDLARGRIDRDQLKTDANLPYPITEALRAILETALARHKDPSPKAHVFLNHKRQPWGYAQLYKVLDHYNKNHWTGDPITFRDLRKSFGTHLALQGCPPNVLRELMGHKEIALTLTYYVAVDLGRMAQWSDNHTRRTGIPACQSPAQPPDPDSK